MPAWLRAQAQGPLEKRVCSAQVLDGAKAAAGIRAGLRACAVPALRLRSASPAAPPNGRARDPAGTAAAPRWKGHR